MLALRTLAAATGLCALASAQTGQVIFDVEPNDIKDWATPAPNLDDGDQLVALGWGACPCNAADVDLFRARMAGSHTPIRCKRRRSSRPVARRARWASKSWSSTPSSTRSRTSRRTCSARKA